MTNLGIFYILVSDITDTYIYMYVCIELIFKDFYDRNVFVCVFL